MNIGKFQSIGLLKTVYKARLYGYVQRKRKVFLRTINIFLGVNFFYKKRISRQN